MVFGIHNPVSKLVVCRKKKYIFRHITDCKLCVVLRKRCTKAPKKMHYSQLVILFRFTNQTTIGHHAYLTTHLPCHRRAHYRLREREPINNTHDIKQTNQNLLLDCTAHLWLKSHPLAAGSDLRLYPSPLIGNLSMVLTQNGPHKIISAARRARYVKKQQP